ncbi:hypothetical protein QHH03_26580, partial [Aphanizomenon sp. 202]|nr:hypothetical protein [Aphanizomenon sp. 202]
VVDVHRGEGENAFVKPVSYTHLDVYKRQAIGNKYSPCPLPPAQEFATGIDGCDIMGDCYTNLRKIRI